MSDVGDAAVRLWLRREAVARWRSLAVLTLLVAATAGLAMAAAAGARRSHTVYDRYREATAAPDVVLFPTQAGVIDADFSGVIDLPEVVSAGQFDLAAVLVEEPMLSSLPPGDHELYDTISRPLIRSGRNADPHRIDEITINNAAAEAHGLEVGDRLRLVSVPDIEAFFEGGGEPTGPSNEATIVGIGDSPMDLLFTPDQPAFRPAGEFMVRHGGVVQYAPNLVVRLRPGTDVEAFRAKAAEVMSLPDIPVRDLSEDRKRYTHATEVERNSLLLFALAVAVAGAVVVGQAIARWTYALAADDATLAALGVVRRRRFAGLVTAALVPAVIGGLFAVVVAVVLSSRFPVGLSRRFEPDLGVHADWVVLVLGGVLTGAGVMASSAVAAWRAVSHHRTPAVAAPSALLRGVRGVAPLPIAIGVGLAADPGRGSRSVPVRPAIGGAIVGVLGIVAAFGLVRGIDDAVANPERAGQLWDGQFYVDSDHPAPGILDGLEGIAGVEAAVRYSVNVAIDGAGVPSYALDARTGAHEFAVLDGRAPSGADEIALGPATAKTIGKEVGDTVAVGGHGDDVTLRVVGTVLLPQTPHSSFDQGAWLTLRGMAEVAPEFETDDGLETVVVVRVPGDDTSELEALEEELGVETEIGIAPPQDVVYLQEVRRLPIALAAFLALLAVSALGHALVLGVRNRRHELAVLRALGFRPRQSAVAIVVQALTIVLVGVAVGLPLGIITGRLLWKVVADSTPLVYVAPLAAVAAITCLPGALGAASALAAVPARRAARLRTTEVLRTE